MLWFHCDNNTGLIVTGGMAADEAQASLQKAPEGQTLFVVPDGTVGNPLSPSPDFTVLKDMVRNNIDKGAGEARLRYITDLPGQSQIYEKKEVEATTWFEGDEISNPSKYPFMIAEADVRGIDISEVCDEILNKVNYVKQATALIEAYRMNAKNLISEAQTLPEIIGNATVDWEAIAP